MADNKTLQTRISLKIDTWANWANITTANQGGNLILKRGEVAFVQVDATMPPVEHTESGTTLITNPNTVLYKVGDGKTAFKDLKWGSALAADVHSWAKEDLNAFNARVSTLITAALNGEGTAVIKGYVTETDFNAFKSELESWKSGITNTEGTGRLDVIEADYTTADEAAAAAKAAADEVLGTDADAATANTVFGAKAAAAAADAKAEQNKTDIATINTNIANNLETKTDAQAKLDEAKQYADNAIDTFYNTYIENDSTALDTLKDVTAWLDANKDGAADIISDITNLQTDKADKTALDAVDARVEALEAIDHDHSNKDVLDGITAAKVADWDDAVAKEHEHANKAELDLIATGDKAKWDAYETSKASTTEFNALASRVETIEEDYLKAADFFYIDGGTSTEVI